MEEGRLVYWEIGLLGNWFIGGLVYWVIGLDGLEWFRWFRWFPV
jgi:hypothetical protein